MIMELVLDEDRPFVVAKVSGEITGSDAESLVETLHDQVSGAGSRVAIELSGLQTIDSGGLSALISLVTRARLSSGQVILVAPSPFWSEIFSITNLDQGVDVVDSLEEARFA